MKKCTILTILCQLALFLMILLLIKSAWIFFIPNEDARTSQVQYVNQVTATIDDGENKTVTLPYSFQQLKSRTPVILETTITPQNDDILYMKSVYSPAKIYLNDTLIYEFGKEENYPHYMSDPATEVHMIKLNGNGEAKYLRMEFLSPESRSTLTVHPPILGSTNAVIWELSQSLGLPFLFSTMELMAGFLLIFISIIVILFEKKGKMFFWLGLFSISSGFWAFGECNYTGLMIKNPTLLYFMAFMGLFCLTIPLLHFALSIIEFHKPKLILFVANLMTVFCIIALLLQFTGKVSLSKSMYFFHIADPLALLFLTIISIYEVFRYKNLSAKRFIFPIGILTLSSILEVCNYKIRFTHLLASLFQMGILFFILFSGITAGMYLRDIINLRNSKRELAFEKNLLELRIQSQKKHHALLAETEDKIKQQRHDLKHQLTVIHELANKGENSELKTYLSKLMVQIPAPSKVYCENNAVNAVVSHYAIRSEQQKIQLEINITVPMVTKQTTDSSLCVIFGNLMENAIEACSRMTDGRKFIKLNSRLQYDMLVITMDNSFDGKIKDNNGILLSSKREEPGVGLTSIKAVAKKAMGSAEFRADGNVFLSSVLLRI